MLYILPKEAKSYHQIIRSTSIFGGAQVINIIIGVLRNKIVAILLGTFGIGLISIYQSIIDLIKSLSSFGIETAGVTEIASNSESESKQLMSIAIVKRWSILFAIFGAFLNLVLCYPISQYFFDNSNHVLPIALLSICTFFTLLAAGEAVILQGLRKISYMVKSGLIWNSIGLALAIPLYLFFRINGIIPVFIIVSICMYFSAYYYRKKMNLKLPSVSTTQLLSKQSFILKLGFYIVIAAVLSQYATFLIKSIITQDLGVSTVGLFQAAWTISNVYIMLILRSMSADFYPRLSGLINNNEENNDLVNQQTYIALIAVTPIIVFLILLTKPIVSLLYTAEFETSSSLLHWLLIGSFFKVISWALGFMLLARGKGLLFFISELFYNLLFVSIVYALIPTLGIDSIGIAYLIAYFSYMIVVYLFSYKLSRFKWNKENMIIGIVCISFILIIFYIDHYQSALLLLLGIPLFLLSLLFSLYKLNKVLPLKSLLRIFRNK